ncbi:422_t:CDS:10, partial [Dentiscutata erythropus]
NNYNSQRCSGMFDKAAIPGGTDPKITLKYDKISKIGASMVVYEYSDFDSIGYFEKGERGSIVFNKDASSIVDHVFNFDSTGEDQSFIYHVNKTGFYCVAAFSFEDRVGDFMIRIDWRNPYGELPASDYPKLPFYGLLSLVYLVIGVIWMTLSIIHWRDILPIQNYISSVILFLMLEMAFNWGYWENYNNYGVSSTFLLCLVVVLNAGRNSISFFMLLIVCMGYGVVKPTLGNTMNKCRALAAAHFIFGIMYAAGTMLIDPNTSGPLIFLVIFPLALTMTTFYIWTLQSITTTLQTLKIRKQSVKSLMYKRLYRLLVFSVSVLGIFFFINMFSYIHRGDNNWVLKYWRWKWFLLDGWLNILYLIVFIVILVIWRPTYNNKRYPLIGKDEELAQEDDYDLDNIGHALESLGYEQIKYRNSTRDHNETERLHVEEAFLEIMRHHLGTIFIHFKKMSFVLLSLFDTKFVQSDF